MKKRMIVDLDVVTVAEWDRGKEADSSRKFIGKVIEGKYYVVTPTSLIQLVKKWKHIELGNKIQEFYSNNSKELVERVEIIEEITAKGIDFEKLFHKILAESIKEEDIQLILVASLKEAKLITYNKIHLRNKKEAINEILSEFGLRAIEIISPEEA